MDLEQSSEHYRHGRAAMERGDYKVAIAEFKESISGHPHFKTLELLGECLLETGDPIVPLAAASSLGSNAFRASYLLARALAEVQDFEGALRHAERAIQMHPDFKAAVELKERILARRPRTET